MNATIRAALVKGVVLAAYLIIEGFKPNARILDAVAA
jgi:hypothetical protein